MTVNINFMQYKPESFEPLDRYCPVCGVKIKTGSFLHHCSTKKLDQIDEANESATEEDDIEDSISEETDRTFFEKFSDSEDIMDRDI